MSRREICLTCSVMTQSLDPMSMELRPANLIPSSAGLYLPVRHPLLPFLPPLPPIRRPSRTRTHITFSKLVDFIVTISEPFSVRFTVYGLAVSSEPPLEMVAALYTLLRLRYDVQRQHCPCSLVPGLFYSDSSFSASCCNGVMFLDRLFSLVALNSVEWLILSCRLSSSAGREENKPRKVLVWKQWMADAWEG